MSTLALIVIAGTLMSAIALVGSLTLVFPEKTLERLTPPLVALAAGSLIGGALFHMLPEAVSELGNGLRVYVWFVAGFFTFFVLEQYLHWHHCHRTISHHKHEPIGYLILLADGVHNFIGGLAVAGAFLIETRLGIVTWLVAAAHEVPQELGDFGILIYSGWDRKKALLFNLLSAITFLIGSLVAYWLSGTVDITFLIPFAAGNFVYIAAADLIPQISSRTRLADKLIQSTTLALGLASMLLVAVLGG